MDWRILYNPLAVLGKSNGLIGAIVVIAALAAVCWWGGLHLDGALDMHLTMLPPSVLLLIAESLIAWLCLGVLLFGASKVFGGNGGLGAHLAAAGLARFALILAAIVASRQIMGKAVAPAMTMSRDQIVMHLEVFFKPVLIFGSLAVVALVAWMIVLLVYGFKESSGLRQGRLAGAFVVGLIVAEVVSKLLLLVVTKAGA